jgi:Domain of unknown function (DUF4340)
MNLRTTLVLLVFAAAGGAFLYATRYAPNLIPAVSPTPADTADAGTSATLNDLLTSDKITGVEVVKGDKRLVLQRGAGGEWSMPGGWPVRQPEVRQLVDLLGGLHSRFAPIPLTPDTDLKAYGLEPPALVVEVRTTARTCRLALGEEPGGEHNRFSRPTYLRLDDKPEVVRLAPGLLSALDRPPEFYQQRRLFPSERVAKEGEPQEKIDRLDAKAIAVKGKEGGYDLKRAGDDWELGQPVRDRVDPDKLRTVLTALPDIWAEQFVAKPDKDLDKYGLKTPEKTVQVTRPSGDAVALLVGKTSQTKVRTVTKAPPPFGGMPEPKREVVHEEYRYAKLQDNEQVFEIKADRLKDVFVAADTLRDPRLARFRTEDARKVEVQHAGQDILLAKDNDRWKLQKPMASDAEAGKVRELLDKLTDLQARDKDILDKSDLKKLGLEKPAAHVTVAVEEETKGEGEAKKQTKTFGFALARNESEKGKAYVKVDGWERVNVVDDAVLKLVERPALAYRGRRVLDFRTAELAKIEVHRGADHYTLENIKGKWELATPVKADIDSGKAGSFADDLGRLEAVEFVNASPKPEELKDQYGLDQPALSVKLTFAAEPKKPPAELLVGKQRPGKDEFFAKLASAPDVFAIRKDTRAEIDRDSLAYLPAQPRQLRADDIAELRVKHGDQEYRLKHDGTTWKIAGPFEATAAAGQVQPLVEALTGLRSERYVAHAAKEPDKYGLDKPAVSVTVVPVAKKDAKEPAKEWTLLLGKPAEGEPKGRYAKLADGAAVFVVDEKTGTALDHGALDLLDRSLLALDAKSITRLHSSAGPLALQKQDNEWRVVEGPGAPYPADRDVLTGVLNAWSQLQAQRYAAYGRQVNLAQYGLDKPAFTLTATVQPVVPDGKPASPVQHTLLIGNAVEKSGERFAKLDKSPGVAVLSAEEVTELTRGPLDFVNRSVLQFDPLAVTTFQRRAGDEELEITRREGGWQMTKPADTKADTEGMEALVKQLSALRAERVAAYPATDLKPFELDPPAATVTLRLSEGKEHVLRLGKAADDKSGDRFAVVDKSNAVVVLAGPLAKRLTAAPLHYRDRTLARFADADRISLQRDRRKATFAKVDGTWKLVEPVQADAEQTELEDFLNALARLRADELVADTSDDLKPYGLDRPEARWQLRNGDKEVLDLLVGAQEKEGPHRYAKLANGSLVFLLDPSLTAKVLAEYRNRTVWPNLDAAQVERLEYRSKDQPFTLERVDNTWRLAGKPDAKVNAEAVQQALDALAGLKAAQYVEDQSKELPLYGLEPPELVLEIHTRTGKRTLHVGRRQGETQRYYARVPEGAGATAVFVLGEGNAQRIVRPLSAFTQGKP